MQDSQTPLKISVTWAAFAGGAYTHAVPVPSQIGVTNGRASWTDGFVPLNFTARAAGGVPPFGDDMNGALNQISAGVQWLQAGGPLPFDSGFSTTIGGYPSGAVIQSSVTPGLMWRSTIDNNTNNPDVSPTGWIASSLGFFNGSTVITTTSSFTVPSSTLLVLGWGPGGGGSGNAANEVGSSGSSGAFGLLRVNNLVVGSTIAVTIGSPGAGGASGGHDGTNGGSVVFGSYMTVLGGIGGTHNDGTATLAPAAPSGTGVLGIGGRYGQNTVYGGLSSATLSVAIGRGGDAPWGGSGGPANSVSDGVVGSGPGGGGGAGASTTDPRAGGNGGPGFFVVYW